GPRATRRGQTVGRDAVRVGAGAVHLEERRDLVEPVGAGDAHGGTERVDVDAALVIEADLERVGPERRGRVDGRGTDEAGRRRVRIDLHGADVGLRADGAVEAGAALVVGEARRVGAFIED